VEIDLHASDGFHNRRSVSHPVFSSEPSYASPLYLTGPAVNEQNIPQECSVTNTSPNTVRLQNLRDALPEFVMTLGRTLSIGFDSRPLFPMALERSVRVSEPFIVRWLYNDAQRHWSI